MTFQFIVVFFSWMNWSMYFNRIPVFDLVHNIAMFFHIVGLFTMTLFMEDHTKFRDTFGGFAVGRVVTLLALLMLHLYAAYFVPRVRTCFHRAAVGHAVGIVLWLASIWLPDSWPIAMWFAGWLAEFLGASWSWRGGRSVAVPIHIGGMSHRHAEIMMVIIGESLLAQVLVDRHNSLRFYAEVLMGMSLGFGIHLLYHSSLPLVANLHAMRRSKNSGRMFMWCSVLFGTSVFYTGAASKLLLAHFNDTLRTREVWFFGGSVASALTWLMFLRMSHRGWRSELGMLRPGDAAFDLQVYRTKLAKNRLRELKANSARRDDRASGKVVDDPIARGEDVMSHNALAHSGGDGAAAPPVPLMAYVVDDAIAANKAAEARESKTADAEVEVEVEVEAGDALAPTPPKSTPPAETAGAGAGAGAAAGAGGQSRRTRSKLRMVSRKLRKAGAGVRRTVRRRVSYAKAYLTTDTTLRRRVLWFLRFLAIGGVLAWTAIVDSDHDAWSPLSLVGGLLLVVMLVQSLDYLDVLSYSDSQHGHHE